MNICVIIPCFNHGDKLVEVCEQLLTHELQIIIVDDASHSTTALIVDQLIQREDIHLVRHRINQGKGGAVMSGLIQADIMGFSHVLQVDADGQHDLADIPRLLNKAATLPHHVISGYPQFDETIPPARKYGRYLTHFLVWVATLSLTIKDSMCGYRVYPLAPCLALMKSHTLGRRMDFDIEILVRLYWRNTDITFVTTRVTYPKNGLSHFQPWADNARISWLHTRLFFGMLLRAPYLIRRKWVLR